MQLTQKQESMISRYLRDLAVQLDDSLPEKVRERSLRQFQTQIYKHLEGLQKANISDEDVVEVLRLATPRRKEAPPENSPAAVQPKNNAGKQPTPAARANRTQDLEPELDVAPVWLGVCAFNADRFGVAPWILRISFVLFGITGPLAVFCYLAGYAEYYLSTEKEERPAIAYGSLAIRIITPLAATIVLRWGAYKFLDLLAFGYLKAFNEPIPALGKWDWIALHDGTCFFLVCASVIPLSIISGLPLANAWGHSLKRLVQALVALYFIFLCFGIAAVLVGLVLQRVEPYLQ